MTQFKTEDDFRAYLKKAISEFEETHLPHEAALNEYISATPEGKEIFAVISDWNGFVKHYLRAVKGTLCKPLQEEASSLEAMLLGNSGLRGQVEEDMGIDTVYDSKGKLREDVVKFLNDKFSDPAVTISSAYDFLRDLDQRRLGQHLITAGEPIVEEIAKEIGDRRMAEHLFYEAVARTIIKIYLNNPKNCIEELPS